jgi:hypothetical protein
MKEFFLKMWKDPVWSKVIAAGILAFIALIWSLINFQGLIAFYRLIIIMLNYVIPIPIWGILLIITIRWVLIQIIQSEKKHPYVSSVWSEEVGNYVFSDLHKELSKLKALERTERMIKASIGPSNENLSVLFWVNRENFNAGVSNKINYSGYDDGGYLAEVVAPKLLSYGLLEKREDKGFSVNQYYSYTQYFISEIGFKYLECIEKLDNESMGLS